MDRSSCDACIDKFDGGPVGVDNLAAAIGEERGTIEDVIEPYLIQQGFLQRTSRGRVATALAYGTSAWRRPRRAPTSSPAHDTARIVRQSTPCERAIERSSGRPGRSARPRCAGTDHPSMTSSPTA